MCNRIRYQLRSCCLLREPQLEKEALPSAEVEAATVQTLGSEAGEKLRASTYVAISESSVQLRPLRVTYVVISSCNGKEQTSSDHRGSGGVGGRRVTSAQAQVDNSLARVLAGVVGSPLHTLNNARHGSASLAVKNLHGHKARALRKTVATSSNSTSAVSSMAVAVSVLAVDSVGTPGGTALEISVPDINTGINDIGSNAGSGGRVIVVV